MDKTKNKKVRKLLLLLMVISKHMPVNIRSTPATEITTKRFVFCPGFLILTKLVIGVLLAINPNPP